MPLASLLAGTPPKPTTDGLAVAMEGQQAQEEGAVGERPGPFLAMFGNLFQSAPLEVMQTEETAAGAAPRARGGASQRFALRSGTVNFPLLDEPPATTAAGTESPSGEAAPAVLLNHATAATEITGSALPVAPAEDQSPNEPGQTAPDVTACPPAAAPGGSPVDTLFEKEATEPQLNPLAAVPGGAERRQPAQGSGPSSAESNAANRTLTLQSGFARSLPIPNRTPATPPESVPPETRTQPEFTAAMNEAGAAPVEGRPTAETAGADLTCPTHTPSPDTPSADTTPGEATAGRNPNRSATTAGEAPSSRPQPTQATVARSEPLPRLLASKGSPGGMRQTPETFACDPEVAAVPRLPPSLGADEIVEATPEQDGAPAPASLSEASNAAGTLAVRGAHAGGSALPEAQFSLATVESAEAPVKNPAGAEPPAGARGWTRSGQPAARREEEPARLPAGHSEPGAASAPTSPALPAPVAVLQRESGGASAQDSKPTAGRSEASTEADTPAASSPSNQSAPVPPRGDAAPAQQDERPGSFATLRMAGLDWSAREAMPRAPLAFHARLVQTGTSSPGDLSQVPAPDGPTAPGPHAAPAQQPPRAGAELRAAADLPSAQDTVVRAPLALLPRPASARTVYHESFSQGPTDALRGDPEAPSQGPVPAPQSQKTCVELQASEPPLAWEAPLSPGDQRTPARLADVAVRTDRADSQSERSPEAPYRDARTASAAESDPAPEAGRKKPAATPGEPVTSPAPEARAHAQSGHPVEMRSGGEPPPSKAAPLRQPTAGGSLAEPDSKPEPARPGQPARDIRLHLADGGQRVEVRLTERAGAVHVAVRTPDQKLASVLREDLPALSSKLEHAGFRAESWGPAAGSPERQTQSEPASTSAGSQDRQEQAGEGGRERRDESGQRRARDLEDSTETTPERKDFAWLISRLQ